MTNKLAGKVAIITGASAGIGEATAIASDITDDTQIQTLVDITQIW